MDRQYGGVPHRKVRILNGAILMVFTGLLNGFETVKSCIDDPDMEFIKTCIYDEIIPTLDLPKTELLNTPTA